MRFRKFQITLLFMFCLTAVATAVGQSRSAKEDTLRLLSEMDNVSSFRDEKLAKLFEVGDARIDHLVDALKHPDPKISLRSQRVIRYLGNSPGVDEMLEWYATLTMIPVSGPIPLPLREWDYQAISAIIDDRANGWGSDAESYMYALALSDSPKDAESLEQMLDIASGFDEHTFAARTARLLKASEPAKVFGGGGRLEKKVLRNAFFVEPADHKHTTARLLAFNGTKDKALIEIYINRGVLAEEWYHVVIRKRENGWQFFSITQVAVS